MNRWAYSILLLTLLQILSGCIPAATVPIQTTPLQKFAAVNRHTLMIFLPGRGDSAASYDKEGFRATLQQQGIAVDTIGVEAHLGYYRDRTLLQRLREDVILPAKGVGYQEIWLVGISLGGLGALLYDTAYPGEVAGVIIMAPYLGEGTLLKTIAAAGGLIKWQPGAVTGDQEQEIWMKFREYAVDRNRGLNRVFLGFGADDRFAATNRFFAAMLPPRQVITLPGGHDWLTWKSLWPRLLEQTPLAALK